MSEQKRMTSRHLTDFTSVVKWYQIVSACTAAGTYYSFK